MANGHIVPFPFLILAVILIIIAVAGLANNRKTFVWANILLSISSELTVAYLV